ncbi:hypothetical protein CPB83DRAFT_861170 [Crepidotus variabilis]|uniref:Uncharacterized protein n=1 Tax=Crepidotus variabilis TaxID=179855 RepID=A0A9P6E8Z4_9AGAR|nr:hypothetical protein CPB83DRAFT_861170 [Crepidotus variabilis]
MSDMATSLSGLSTRPCKTCRIGLLPAFSTFVNCQECRARKNSKQRERTNLKLKRPSLLPTINLDSSNDNDASLTASHTGSAKENTSSRNDEHSLSFPPVSKKSFGNPINGDALNVDSSPDLLKMRLLHELEGQEKMTALKEMKTMLKAKVGASETRSLVVDNMIAHSTECQTASALYIKLKNKAIRVALAASSSSSPTRVLNFKGWHCIVAVDSISHEQRMDLVIQDLKKIAKIAFSSSNAATSTPNCASRSFACHCLGTKTSSSPASLQEVISKCKGRVFVVVESDSSHFKGVVGQRIEINVTH